MLIQFKGGALNYIFCFSVSVSADTDAGWYSCAAVSESGSCLARAEVAVARDSDRPPPILQLGPVNQVAFVELL